MLLSKTCDYGIRASLYVATQEDQRFVPIKEISENLSISFHFLTKILQKLTQQKIMKSFRGPNGGVALARPASSTTLMDVIMAIEEPDFFNKCLLGLDECGDENPCPVHDQWGKMREDLKSIFENTTLANLAEKIRTDKYRIANIAKKET